MKTLAFHTAKSLLPLILLTAVAPFLTGCNVDSFFNPSRTGYFESTPTTVPILDRIDVIDRGDSYWSNATRVTPSDLVPSDLSYRLSPGDVVTVEIFALLSPGQWSTSTRRVDAGGNLRLPELGDIPASGMTAQEFQEQVSELVSAEILTGEAQVEVVVEEGGGLMYTIYGFLSTPGRYLIRDPDLRLLDALAVSGGVPPGTKRIYVIRQVSLTDQSPANEQRLRDFRDRRQPGSGDPTPNTDIEDLIRELDQPSDNGARPSVFPAAYSQDDQPLVDIDELQTRGQDAPAVDVDSLQGPVRGGATYIYDETRGEWIAVQGTADTSRPPMEVGDSGTDQMVVERVIEVDYQRLSQGDMGLNVVIRPDDLIYVAGPRTGVVYVEGEVNRPGVYQLPTNGSLTLSRLIAAAGGFGPLAIPERVDLIRIVGQDREAVVRLNLAAIRQRTEPDVYLKSDDHIIIGTNWIASPLAVIRNGFRATYGFGFLLDRNFGNDVFGAPPTNRQGF